MNVSSYLELYLSVFGWILFDEIWRILTDSGLAYLPFVGMLLRNIVEPMYQQDLKEASQTSLRRIELDIFCMLTVVVLATQPILALNFGGLSYSKACSGKPAVNPGATGTTYDTTFTTTSLGGTTARVPVWWYGVFALSAGFNDAVIASIPCSADIRLITYQMQNSRVKDPQLRNQVKLFYNDCYRYALARFFDTKIPYPTSLPSDDLYWLGSQFLQSQYYDQQRASETIPGFPYDARRDLEYDPAIETPVYGKPTCLEWWTGAHANSPNAGLRQALVNQIDTTLLTELKTTVASLTGKSQSAIEDIAIKTLISREQTHFNGLQNLQHYNDRGVDIVNSAAGTLGSLLESISFYPKMYMVKVAAPIIQATVLMLIVLALPFVMVFASYDIGTLMTMTVILFSVKFWTVLWAVAHWLDNHLLEALEPQTWYQFDIANNNGTSIAETVINFMTGLLFIGLPVFWSGALSWAGVRMGRELSSLTGDNFNQAEKIGASGVSATKTFIGKGIKK